MNITPADTPLSNATPQDVGGAGDAGAQGTASRSDHVHAQPGQVPVGGVIPWFGNITGVPALNANWEECDGTAIANTSSPMFGQNKPALNGTTDATRIILRGSTTSGGTGGAATVTLTTTELPAHTHTIASVNNNSGAGTANTVSENANATNDTVTSNSTGSGSAFSIIPPVMNTRYIMRVL